MQLIMRRVLAPAIILGGFGLGSRLMRWMETPAARRGREEGRGKLVHLATSARLHLVFAAHDLRNALVRALRDLRIRMQRGVVADNVLEERVRRRISGIVKNPDAVIVFAQNGRVRVSGPILADDAERIIPALQRVRGVIDVDNQLEMGGPDHPALQNALVPVRGFHRFMNREWTPAQRIALGVGTGVGAFALRRVLGPRTSRLVLMGIPIARRFLRA